MKIDLRKAYKTLDWDFLYDMLIALNFPRKFTKIVMACATLTRYSLVIDGSPLPEFKAQIGVRQGDPMSPLLFVIGMEYLSRALSMVNENPDFKFHPRCSRIKLNHLAFADNLMLFCKGDLQYINILTKTVDYFFFRPQSKQLKIRHIPCRS